MNGEITHDTLWYPLKQFGITHSSTALHATTIINTWIALAALVVAIVIARYFLSYTPPKKTDGPPGIQPPILTAHAYGNYIVKAIIKSFITLVEQSTGSFKYRYFAFIASLFTFILFCNWIALLPFVEEPTKDLNTTLAFGIIALVYIQKEIIHVRGLKEFLREIFLPVATFFPLNIIIGLVHLPLKVLGELASVISLSFRLFGNIFGGAIIMEIFSGVVAGSIIRNALATLLGVNLLLAGFFILFEGGLQAFVFAILTLTNIGMATSVEEGKH